MHYRIYMVAALLLFVCDALQAQQPPCPEYEIANLRKTAIVIGEKSYKGGAALQHTFNDAADMRDSLKKIGFEVVTYLDADRRTLEDGINNWSKQLNQYDVALFYFSGHGAEVAGENFLFPIDADPQQISDLKFSCYSANEILERMDGSSVKYNIMLLDACRENPFLKRWEKGPINNGGMTVMSGTGLFLGLAAQPGKVASDGSSEDRNGVYTAAILRNITTTNTDIDDIFTTVNREVREKSSGGQIPHKQSTLSAKFCFTVAHQAFKTKDFPFLQPASQILLTRDQQELVTADSTSNEFCIRDSKSLSKFNENRNSLKPYKLIGRSTDKIYVIDSAGKKLSVIKRPDFSEVFKVILPADPVSIAITLDESTAFIGCKDSSQHGIIIQVDLAKKTVVRTLSTLPGPAKIVLSSDGKRLYAICSGHTHDFALYDFDVKSGKLVKQLPGVAAGEAIGITPDNSRLYVSFDSAGFSSTNVIDVAGWTVKKRVDQQSLGFAFTVDGKFVLVTSIRSVVIIKADENEIVNILPFATRPNGVAITDDDRALVWLPDEHRPYSLDISANLQSGSPTSADEKLNSFRAKTQRTFKEALRFKLRPIFDRIRDTLWQIPQDLVKDLPKEGEFRANYNILEYDSAGLNCSSWIAVYSGVDAKKSIYIDYAIQGSLSSVIVSFKARDDTKWLSRTYGVDTINWALLRKEIREYFIDRLDSHLSF